VVKKISALSNTSFLFPFCEKKFDYKILSNLNTFRARTMAMQFSIRVVTFILTWFTSLCWLARSKMNNDELETAHVLLIAEESNHTLQYN
jgi:hypothetical protein